MKTTRRPNVWSLHAARRGSSMISTTTTSRRSAKSVSTIWARPAGQHHPTHQEHFQFAFDSGRIVRPVRGADFNKPSKTKLRTHRKAKQAKYGKRMFEPEQIRALIDAANPAMRAMIYLAANCGYGNNDCAMLPFSAVNLKTGFVDFARPKTGVDRRCPLWPETVKAIREAIVARPTPKSVDHAQLIFVTKSGGSWHKKTNDNPVSREFGKLLVKLEMYRPGLSFTPPPRLPNNWR